MVSEFAFNFNKRKKALVLSVKLALNNQLIFTCSNTGIETLEQVVKYVKSLAECTEFTSKRNSSNAKNLKIGS